MCRFLASQFPAKRLIAVSVPTLLAALALTTAISEVHAGSYVHSQPFARSHLIAVDDDDDDGDRRYFRRGRDDDDGWPRYRGFSRGDDDDDDD